jgi:glycerol-3-phosphate dehydrogenase subunit B
LVDFKGLKAFSAKGIAVALRKDWPGIMPVTLTFPDLQWAGELYPEAVARSLEVAANREALAAIIRPHIEDAKCVGLPAILGIYGTASVQKHMAELLGVPVFEILTLPPAVPGIRLRETLDDYLRDKGMAVFSQRYAFAVRKEGGLFHIDVGEVAPQITLKSRCLILATGRFLSGGLVADRTRGVFEPLMELPVAAPANREEWHKDDFFDAAGQPGKSRGRPRGYIFQAAFR